MVASLLSEFRPIRMVVIKPPMAAPKILIEAIQPIIDRSNAYTSTKAPVRIGSKIVKARPVVPIRLMRKMSLFEESIRLGF